MPTPAQLEQLKKMVDAGPPPEPTGANPGPLMQELTAYANKRKEATGAEPNIGDLLLHLVYVLDVRQWHEAVAAWNQMKKMYEMRNPPLITRPGFVPPRDLIKP